MITTLLSAAAAMALAGPTTTIKAKNLEFNVKVGAAGTSSDCEEMTAAMATIRTSGFAVVPFRRAEGNYCAAIGTALKPKYRSTINFEVAETNSRSRTLRAGGKQFINTSDLAAALSECKKYRDTAENLAVDGNLKDQSTFVTFSTGCLITSSSTVELSTTVQITKR